MSAPIQQTTETAAPVTPADPAAGAPRTLAHVMAARRVPRARTYLRLLLILPAAAILAIGLWGYLNVEPGGTVESIKVRTKEGPVGQAAEALRLVTGTFDLFLKVKTTDAFYRTPTYKDMAIGNGLLWQLPRQCKLQDVKSVDIWDEHTIRSDKNLDHVSMDGQWANEGQTFRVELIGHANEPPRWALPMLAVGATLTGLVLLRFVWDQVV